MAKLEFCVYVLYSLRDGKLYIGFTTDLKQRLTDHYDGKCQSTAPRRPLRLVFCEYYLAKTDAVRREQYLKTGVGKRMLKLLVKDSLRMIQPTPTSYSSSP